MTLLRQHWVRNYYCGNQGEAEVNGCKGMTEMAVVVVREKYDDAVNYKFQCNPIIRKIVRIYLLPLVPVCEVGSIVGTLPAAHGSGWRERHVGSPS